MLEKIFIHEIEGTDEITFSINYKTRVVKQSESSKITKETEHNHDKSYCFIKDPIDGHYLVKGDNYHWYEGVFSSIVGILHSKEEAKKRAHELILSEVDKLKERLGNGSPEIIDKTSFSKRVPKPRSLSRPGSFSDDNT